MRPTIITPLGNNPATCANIQRSCRLAIKGRRIGWLVLFLLALVPGARAQMRQAHAAADDEGERPFEVFGGYSYLREDGQDLHGWTGTFIGNINQWFGLAADFDGHYGTERVGRTEIRRRLHGFTFGPHVAFPNSSRVTPFAFALFGGERETIKLAGVSESATGFAANLGGGLDVRVNHRLSVRVLQVDAAYTRFDGHGTTSPRLSTGLVYHFGKPH